MQRGGEWALRLPECVEADSEAATEPPGQAAEHRASAAQSGARAIAGWEWCQWEGRGPRGPGGGE
eukprot:1760771-Rhodomonas_salina.4